MIAQVYADYGEQKFKRNSNDIDQQISETIITPQSFN